MISSELFIAFVASSVLLMIVPGPNVALIVANSVAHGRRYGLLTVAGTSAAMAPQLLLTAFGMSGVLTSAAYGFEWIRWAGVLYLVWLGLQAWLTPPADLTGVRPQAPCGRTVFARGFLVSLANPKTLLFYGAFFPQFLNPKEHVPLQFAVLSVTFLTIAVLLDSCWAIAATRLKSVFALRGRLRSRVTGGLLLGAALGLAAARRPG